MPSPHRAEFEFFLPEHAPVELLALARQEWPARRLVFLATATGSHAGRLMTKLCVVHLANLCEVDTKSTHDGRTLYVGMLPPPAAGVLAKTKQKPPLQGASHELLHEPAHEQLAEESAA